MESDEEAEFHDVIPESEDELADQLAALKMDTSVGRGDVAEDKVITRIGPRPSARVEHSPHEDEAKSQRAVGGHSSAADEQGDERKEDRGAAASSRASEQEDTGDLGPPEESGEEALPTKEDDKPGQDGTNPSTMDAVEGAIDEVVKEAVGDSPVVEASVRAGEGKEGKGLGTDRPEPSELDAMPELSASPSSSSDGASSGSVVLPEPESFEERRAAMAWRKSETRDQPLFGGWGGVFSVFGGIKEKASSQLNRLCDVLDPNVTPDVPATPVEDDAMAGGEGEKKSIKSIFDRYSPGGIKKIETTMGVTIEPISSSSSIADVPVEGEGDAAAAAAAAADHGSGEDSREPQLGEQMGTLGKNIYAVGLSTLERIGRTTANVVLTTKDRLAPMLDSQMGERAMASTIDRGELKKPFLELFDEFSGNLVLEKLHLSSTEASIALKSKLKTLNPTQLRSAQTLLRGVGSRMDGGEDRPDAANLHLDDCRDYFCEDERTLVDSLIQSIKSRLTTLAMATEAVEEVRRSVDGSLPLDHASLIVYVARLNLARLLSASLYLVLLFNYDAGDEDQLCKLIVLTEKHLAAVMIADACATLVDAKRREALGQLLLTDLEHAKSILRDASLAVIPRLKLSRYLQEAGRGKNACQ